MMAVLVPVCLQQHHLLLQTIRLTKIRRKAEKETTVSIAIRENSAPAAVSVPRLGRIVRFSVGNAINPETAIHIGTT